MFLNSYPLGLLYIRNCRVSLFRGCLDDLATLHLDTVTIQPAPSDTVMICPTNVCILWQSDPTGIGLSNHLQTAQFDPSEVSLNVGYDNPTHGYSDPFSAPPSGGGGDSSDHNTQMALLKNTAAPPERTSPTHGSDGRKPDLTKPQIWGDQPNRAPHKHGSMVSCWVGSTIPRVRLVQRMCTTLHAAMVAHHQAGLIVTMKILYGTNRYSDN